MNRNGQTHERAPTHEMCAYYASQDILPTHAGFKSPDDLTAYAKLRAEVFGRRLSLPRQVFRTARLLEFGPDSGENSLVFAQWGAACTLYEPNIKAHANIRSYFTRFGLSSSLVDLRSASVAECADSPPDEKFDIIDAEGFIFTVKPDSLWMGLFARLLNDSGFVIVSYVEAYGSFFELLLKVIHARVRFLTGMNSIDCASQLYAAKWASIPHTRAFASWVMDVLDNPFVRLKYFVEPQALCRQMHDAGFLLYSSWPPYKDGLSVDWIKKPLTREERLKSQERFISRSRLSHFLGRTCFLIATSSETENLLWSAVTLVDGLVESFDCRQSIQCRAQLAEVLHVVDSARITTCGEDVRALTQALESAQQILRLLEDCAVDEVVRFCNEDPAFIASWGAPAHYAVFCRL